MYGVDLLLAVSSMIKLLDCSKAALTALFQRDDFVGSDIERQLSAICILVMVV